MIKKVPKELSKDCQIIIEMMGGEKIKKFSPITDDFQKVANNRDILKIKNNYIKEPKISSPVIINEILDDRLLAVGGFSEIRYFVVKGIKPQ